MLDGMKTAAQGMLSMMAKQDVTSQNLANVSTPGYRKDTILISSFTDVLDQELAYEGYMQSGVSSAPNTGMKTYTASYFNQGTLSMTDRSCDLALDDLGKGFFTVETKEGKQFTRNGNFRLKDGYLVTADGSKLLGKKGPIKVSSADFKVDDKGRVFDGDKQVNELLISTFDDNRLLTKSGYGNFKPVKEIKEKILDNVSVKQGYLEMANVNVLSEMVEMMSTMRAFEAGQKVMQSEDQALSKSANEVGKVRG